MVIWANASVINPLQKVAVCPAGGGLDVLSSHYIINSIKAGTDHAVLFIISIASPALGWCIEYTP